jgi:hypothetical protein
MKDLYLQLGIDSNAGRAEIETAVAERPELENAAAILLNESRRAAYNRSVSTIRSIGMLRHRLGLDKENSWFVETCPDFAPRLHIKKYAAQQPAAEVTANSSVSSQAEHPPSKQPKPWLKILVVGLVIAALVLLLNFYL